MDRNRERQRGEIERQRGEIEGQAERERDGERERQS
jgi:hypothetical protein